MDKVNYSAILCKVKAEPQTPSLHESTGAVTVVCVSLELISHLDKGQGAREYSYAGLTRMVIIVYDRPPADTLVAVDGKPGTLLRDKVLDLGDRIALVPVANPRNLVAPGLHCHGPRVVLEARFLPAILPLSVYVIALILVVTLSLPDRHDWRALSGSSRWSEEAENLSPAISRDTTRRWRNLRRGRKGCFLPSRGSRR